MIVGDVLKCNFQYAYCNAPRRYGDSIFHIHLTAYNLRHQQIIKITKK
jgi:hypothetical protein